MLALTVDLGGTERAVYLEWPEGEEESPLFHLLDAMDLELGDLYGRRLLADRTGDHYVAVTPTERPRGSDRWSDGVLVGLGLAVVVLASLVVMAGAPLAVWLLWLVLTVGWIPYAVYNDAWYLRTHSDWNGGPLFWAGLSALPGVNLATGLAYLRQRSRATFFDDRS